MQFADEVLGYMYMHLQIIFTLKRIFRSDLFVFLFVWINLDASSSRQTEDNGQIEIHSFEWNIIGRTSEIGRVRGA